MEIKLSRRSHDVILRNNPALLKKAFEECGTPRWTLNGVLLRELSKETFDQLAVENPDCIFCKGIGSMIYPRMVRVVCQECKGTGHRKVLV